jgi:hypothetical protein
MPTENMGDPMTFPPVVRSHGAHTATDSTREGSSTGTLRHGEMPPIISGTTPYSGLGYVSLSLHRDGQPLIPSNPPSRPSSVNGGSHIQHDLPRTQLTSPPSLSSKSSVTPNIWFDRLKGVLPTKQLSKLRRLISHHGLQWRQLVLAGSAFNELQAEAHNVRTSAESLTGRVDRVLYNMIQVVQDRDIVISSIGRAFDDAPEPQVGTNNIGPSGSTPEHNSSEIPAPNIGHSDHSHNAAGAVGNREKPWGRRDKAWRALYCETRQEECWSLLHMGMSVYGKTPRDPWHQRRARGPTPPHPREQIIYQMIALLEASPIISGHRSAYLMRCTENSHCAERMRTKSNTGIIIKCIGDW